MSHFMTLISVQSSHKVSYQLPLSTQDIPTRLQAQPHEERVYSKWSTTWKWTTPEQHTHELLIDDICWQITPLQQHRQLLTYN